MPRRPSSRFVALLALPLALFAAMPSVQWCSGPWVPLTDEQFAACLASEFTGCTATVACSLPSCGASTESPSSDPAAADAPRAFCVGSPAGGFGLRPTPGDASSPHAAYVDGAAVALSLPSCVRGERIATPDTEPFPDPRLPTAPIRGPPSA